MTEIVKVAEHAGSIRQYSGSLIANPFKIRFANGSCLRLNHVFTAVSGNLLKQS